MRKRFAFAILAAPLWAQDPLSLKDAVQIALAKHPTIEASAAALEAAQHRIEQARAGYYPKLNYTESYTRSNNPVFVFSSKLAQRRFTAEDFAIDSLNHPDSINNFQSQVMLDQLVYDFGMTKNVVQAARLGADIASQDERRARMHVMVGVLRAYYGTVLSAESLRVAEEAVRSAEADLQRAEAIRAAGMSTDADVLSIRVHLASVREQRIRRSFDLEVAKAALNEALGLPLETPHTLASTLVPALVSDATLAQLEQVAAAERPEARQTLLAVQLAQAQASSAKAGYWPRFFVRAGVEADRNKFLTEGGGNWLASAGLQWNLFNGFETRARTHEVSQALRGARAQERRAASGIRLEVREAYFNLQAAQERIEVARVAVQMAEESLRITKNRYESGLSNVTELLRNETALLETRLRHLTAIYDQRLAAGALEVAAGTLTVDSAVMN